MDQARSVFVLPPASASVSLIGLVQMAIAADWDGGALQLDLPAGLMRTFSPKKVAKLELASLSESQLLPT